jgi:hypothetical protein
MGRANIAYKNKDYESIRLELLAKIPRLTDRWTDFNHSYWAWAIGTILRYRQYAGLLYGSGSA